jgi:hypothetical protein
LIIKAELTPMASSNRVRVDEIQSAF